MLLLRNFYDFIVSQHFIQYFNQTKLFISSSQLILFYNKQLFIRVVEQIFYSIHNYNPVCLSLYGFV